MMASFLSIDGNSRHNIEPLFTEENYEWDPSEEPEEANEQSREEPLVTVVIPTYNRARYLPNAIESVLNQTIDNWKLLIVDDASTDKTKKVVQRYLDDPRIEYVRLKKNKGVSHALKKALKMVDTKYFAQLDSDDWYEPKTLDVCIRKMEKAGHKVAMCYGNERLWKEKKKGKFKKKERKKKRQIKGKYDFITYHPMIYPRFYRTKCLKKVGGWSTSVPEKGRYAEDRQILLKLIKKYKFKYINQTLYNRLNHKKNNSRSKNAKKYARVTKYLYKKALKDWGNKYKPKFTWVSGRLKVGKLVKRKKKKKRRKNRNRKLRNNRGRRRRSRK
ncbi:MAG: glycosyltransferase family 2 protein [Bacillaceae bacterium]|nr:glycosyltransferase family 2 protein [Bacillaceae bacterium]